MKQVSALSKHPVKRLLGIKIGVEIIVALLVILWVYTGTMKLVTYSETAFQMGRSPFIKDYAGFLAAAVPISELIIAALLVFNKTRLLGLYASFGLMLLFTGYIYAMLHYSPYVPCSCGGVLAALSWENHLIFNSMYTIITLIGVLLQLRLQRINKLKATTLY